MQPPPLATSTRVSYARDVVHFEAFCTEIGARASLPTDPDLVARYLAASAKLYATATLQRRLQAIIAANRAQGFDALSNAEVVRQTMREIARDHTAPQRRAAALDTAAIKAMLAHCPDDLAGIRDAAMILAGFMAALRRSEIVAIDREHLDFDPLGVRLFVASAGVTLVLPAGTQRQTCPARALLRWIEASATRTGPVFRGVDRWGHVAKDRLHADGVRRILARAAARAGIEVAADEALSPHGLRAGFAAQSYRGGARTRDIMLHTRHKSHATLRSYLRRSNKASDNPARLLGL